MLAASGPQWFDRRRPEHTWPSIVVSVGITAALFVSAFLAMQTVGRWSSRVAEKAEPPVVVQLTPPPPPIERPRPTRAPATPSPLAPPAVSPTRPIVAPTTVTPITGAAPITVAPATPSPRDTASGAAKGLPAIPLGPLPLSRSPSDSAVGPPAGAAAREAGVTIGSRIPNTAAYRDSMLKAKLQPAPYLAAKYAPTGEILSALRESQRAARAVYRRNTTAGSAEVHVAQGEGVDGVGAVGGGSGVQGNGLHAGSGFALPLLSKGPSAAQRKKDEIIDADNRDRLHRLQDRMLLKRDSIRLDSLRRDSLRRDSLAKRRP
jgi:hypothetical protein